jgi:flavin reductase (DIM6/NTAB) family NADH-FMN oxidoreductase RutF
MSKVQWKGGALLAPIPAVMVTCGTMEHPNVITIAWTGILNTIPPKTYIAVRPSRFSYPIIRESGEFVINLTTEELIRACDFCGVRSGKDIDKIKTCGLHLEPSSQIRTPMLAESPVSLECKVYDIIPMGSHDLFLADIVAVNVEEKHIDAAGKLHIDDCRLSAFAHGEYFSLGKKIGSFGFSVRKKKKKKRPNQSKKHRSR